MEAVWSLICNHAEKVQDEGLVIKGEFARIRVSSFPNSSPPFKLAARLLGQEGITYLIGASILSPAGDFIYSKKGELVSLNGKSYIFIHNFDNVTFPEPGDYFIKVLINGKPISNSVLTIELQ